MSLIIHGKDEAEWINIRKQLIRQGNSLENNALFTQVSELFSNLHNLEATSRDKLLIQVFIPILSHYLDYAQKQYKSNHKEILNNFLKQTFSLILTIENVKPSKATEEFIEIILQPTRRYYYNKKENNSSKQIQTALVIPLTSDIDKSIIPLPTKNQDKKQQQYWVSDSDQQTGQQTQIIKQNEQYSKIVVDFLQQFFSSFKIRATQPNHTFIFYLRLLKDLQTKKVIYKHKLLELYRQVRKVLVQKIQNATEEELKDQVIENILYRDSILYGIPKSEEKSFLIQLMFSYQIKLWNSVNVYNRLKGANLLSELCEDVYFKSDSKQVINQYVKKIGEEKIIEKIFTLDANEQILTKSQKIFNFIVRTNALSNQNLKQIIHLAIKGNQNQRKIVFDMIGKIIIRFSLEQILTINSVIFNVPIPDLTVEMIKLLFNAGKFVQNGKHIMKTYDFFWNIVSNSENFSNLKIDSGKTVLDSFTSLFQKAIEISMMTIQGIIDSLVTPNANYRMFQILTKLVRSLPQTKINQKYYKFKVLKTDALKYLVEEKKYQDYLLSQSKQQSYIANQYMSFLTTMIEGYRPFSQKYLGVQILTQLTNQPVMFQNILMYYKSDCEQLFNLLITMEVQNVLQFESIKKVFIQMHKLVQNKNQNPHLLDGYDLMFQILLNSKSISVKEQTAIFCIQLIYNYYNGISIEDRLELQQSLVRKSLNKLIESQQQNVQIGWLIFIQQLLNQTEMQGVGILKSHGNLVPTKYVTLMITNETFGYTSGNRESCIRINFNSSLFELLQKIAFEYKANPQQLNIYSNDGFIKPRYNSKTISQLHLVNTPLVIRSTLKPEIQKSPLLRVDENQTRVLSPQATNVFIEVFYRFACKGFIGKTELDNLMKAATDDQYDYDTSMILGQFDIDKDNKLSNHQFMNWMLDNCKFRQNQVRRMLQNLRYRPDLVRYGQKKLDHTKLVRYQLFNEQSIYEFLFSTIKSKNKDLSQISRRLLIRLPTYRKSLQWLNQINTENQFILWYQLLLIQYLLQDSSNQLFHLIFKQDNVQQWKLSFLTGGYHKILEIVQNILKSQSNQQSQSIYLALKIITKISCIPNLIEINENTQVIKARMLQINQNIIEQILKSIGKIEISLEQLQAYFGLLLHYSKTLNLNNFVFHENNEIRKLTSNFLFLHRKLYGRNQDLFLNQINPDRCEEYYSIVLKQMQEDPTTYQNIYPVLQTIITKSKQNSLLLSTFKIIDYIFEFFPQKIQHTNIQSIILEGFKQYSNELMKPVFNILVKTNINSLTNYLLKYFEPLKQVEKIPLPNKNAKKYVGLKNLGCICYMNAMLQQLFMTKDFVIELSKSKGKQQKGITHELKRMFNYLENSQRLDYNPRQFCYAFDNKIKLHIQEDTQQFVNKMFDRLQFDCPQLVNFIEKQFGGKTISVRHCPCGAVVARQQKFFHLTLQVKDLNTLNQSLNKFIAPETIPEVYCQSCQKKEQINRSTYLLQLPETLIIHLQRMTFDLETLVRIKLHNFLQFPKQVQFKPFVYKATKDYKYSLKGVIIHTGNPDAGHYYSLVKLQSQWYKFDDSYVSQFKGDFNKQCFGGDYDYGDFHVKSSKNAYILVYQKKKQVMNLEQSTFQCQFKEQVQNDNKIFQRELRFHNKQIENLITKLINQSIIPKSYQKQTTKKSQSLLNIYKLIRRYLQLSTQISESTFNTLSKTIPVFIHLNSNNQSENLIKQMLQQKQFLYKTITQSPNQWIRKIYKIIVLRTCVDSFKKYPNFVEQILNYFYIQKPFEKLQISKASELFQLLQNLVQQNIKTQKQDKVVLLSHVVIQLTLNKIVKYINDKLQKQQKHRVTQLKTILINIVNISVHQIINNFIKFEDSPLPVLKSTQFYKNVIQYNQSILQGLSLLAAQFSYDNQNLSQKLFTFFLQNLSVAYYLNVIPNFLRINDQFKLLRIQTLIGIPQRIINSTSNDFSIKSSSAFYSNVLMYAPYTTKYKTLIQQICQTSNYANRDTTFLVETLLSQMLAHTQLFGYVVALSPPNYKYGSILDMIYEYLAKMKDVSDRKYEVIHNLYYRVEQTRQSNILKNPQDQLDTIVLDSVLPFEIIGRTVYSQKLEPLILQQNNNTVKVQQNILYTYSMISQPIIDGNIQFPKVDIDDVTSDLYKFYVSCQHPQVEDNKNDCEATLIVLQIQSTCPIKLCLQNQAICVKFLIDSYKAFLNFPYSISQNLSIGIEIIDPSKQLSSNKQIPLSNQTQFSTASQQTNQNQDTMIQGLVCQICTFLNPFTAQRCQMCQTDL